MTMKKIVYQKPAMQMVHLHQQAMLLAGSGVDAQRSSYGEATTEEWN